jgi:hypothetical protein
MGLAILNLISNIGYSFTPTSRLWGSSAYCLMGDDNIATPGWIDDGHKVIGAVSHLLKAATVCVGKSDQITGIN